MYMQTCITMQPAPYLDAVQIVLVQLETGLVAAVERRHEGGANVGVRQTEGVSEFVRGDLEHVCTWRKAVIRFV